VDGQGLRRREKSLLRAVGGPLLPPAVTGRTKAAYPSLRSHRPALLAEARQLAADAAHPVFGLVDQDWLGAQTSRATAELPTPLVNTLEWVLNAAAWSELHRPVLCL
jgi:asparagine synthase (glutamine-hydrolysing)